MMMAIKIRFTELLEAAGLCSRHLTRIPLFSPHHHPALLCRRQGHRKVLLDSRDTQGYIASALRWCQGLNLSCSALELAGLDE